MFQESCLVWSSFVAVNYLLILWSHIFSLVEWKFEGFNRSGQLKTKMGIGGPLTKGIAFDGPCNFIIVKKN